MNKLIPIFAVVAVLVCADAFAYAITPLPPKGRIKVTNENGGSGGGNTAAKKPIKKADLPPAADVAALDTAKFDQIAKELSFTEDQLKRVDTAKAGVEEEIKKLANAQKEARAAYDKADTECAANAAAAAVMKAAGACKSFNPNQRFEDMASGIMTQDQRLKYRQELKKS